MMFRAGFISSLVMVTTSCGGSNANTATRSAVTFAANESISTALKVYDGEQNTCTERAETKADGKACLLRVRQTWKPVWDAWDTFRSAEDYVTAYCGLVKAFPKDIQPMPVDGVLCLGQ